MLGLGNPILDEIDRKHAELSPPAQQAIALSGVPANARGLMGSVTPESSPAEAPMVSAPSSGQPAAPESPLIAAPSRMRGLPSAETPDATAHKAELNRLVASPSGIGQIHNPFARHGLQVLDAIGGAFFPGFEQRLPGTQGHHDVLVHQAQNNVNEDEKLLADAASREHTAAETGELGARAEHEQAAADALKSPKPGEAAKTVETDQGIMQWDPATQRYDIRAGGSKAPKEAGTVHQLEDGSLVIAHPDGSATAVTLNGQPVKGKPEAEKAPTEYGDFKADYLKRNPNATAEQIERAYHSATRAPEDHGVTMIGPDGKVLRLQPGQTAPQGSMTTAGFNSTNVPTSQTRAMAEVAPKVVGFVDRINQLIDQQEKSLGPGSSRFREFMAGKVGAADPEYSKLRTDIGLLQTALMRMHVGARGGEQMMEHFRSLIDGAKQDPANMRAALGEIRAYAQEVGAAGHSGGTQGTQGTQQGPKAGDVRDYQGSKYKFDGKEWVKQ